MNDKPAYENVILDHYRKEAELFQADASSTMRDQITRGREVDAILSTLAYLEQNGSRKLRLLDIGCGNGYLLEQIRQRHADMELMGLEYTPELVEIARQRGVEGCEIVQGDVRDMPFENASFDIIVTERCIINVMDQQDQAKSIAEVARILRQGGHYICIEAFTDGLENLNAARGELGLEPNDMPYHNLWFDKGWFLDVIKAHFDVASLPSETDPAYVPFNFLSSHYFMSRVVYPAVTRADIVYNSHFVSFFSFLEPRGNYCAIQFWLLQRK
ncbi:class I SAM-dependent methyltransferase [Sphingosinicella terrae]|uniref:class I SAM-dependent methyltransferase n=1 Tax=Sphingosinicella terrae TaxID=2172047 RepID=UPI000E0CC56B|nr:class I SAM-dependent methyltransferase [Sphingosinicella terrae]